MTRAVQAIARAVRDGSLDPEQIGEEPIDTHLNSTLSGMPDPDLLVRTGGEQRISNYLLWQCAYAELYFTPVFWPDFNRAELEKAIVEYQQRERRYGKTSEQLTK